MKLCVLQCRADIHELAGAKWGASKMICVGAVALPGETERSSPAHPGERCLCTSPTAASSPYRKAAEKELGSPAVHGNRVRSNKHGLKWDNQTRYQTSHFVHEDRRHWNRLPREVIQSLSLDVFQIWLCKTSRDPFPLLSSYNSLWTWTKLLGGEVLLEISSLNIFQIK